MTDLAEQLGRLAREAARDELPELLGAIVEAEARVRLRLAEVQTVSSSPSSRVIGGDEAVVIAGTSKRWLLSHTAGLAFRRDLSRKQPRFDEAGLRAWLAARRRP